MKKTSDVREITSKAAFGCCEVVQGGITKMLKYSERIFLTHAEIASRKSFF